MSSGKFTANKKILLYGGIFALIWFVQWKSAIIANALSEAILMLSEYVHEHVLLCLVPAMFIAGAITCFLNQQAVMKYLGPNAKKYAAYGVASISGAILAVCSCTVLPIFKGIYRKGAGIGPAVAFLYSGPAINILAIILSAKVFGWKLGLARTVFALLFAVIIGLLMALIFRKEDKQRIVNNRLFEVPIDRNERSLGKTAIYMASMIGILIFLNWASSKGQNALWDMIFSVKYWIVTFFAIFLVYAIIKWFNKEERLSWLTATRDFALQIMPLLAAGVLLSGFLLGRPGHNGIIPNKWIAQLLGGNSFFSNFFAASSGALMYFATLTEIPIVQGLIGAGMGNGPALSLLLAGPSLSLPSILVIAGEFGWKKVLTYIGLVILLSSVAGLIFGCIN